MTEVNTRTITIPQLHDMIRGYVKTALLRTALDLRVFDELVGAPAQATAVAQAVGADARGMRILLDALTAIGLLHRDGARYALLPGGERLLVSTSPQFFGHASRLSASDWEWDAQKRLIDAVRRGGTVMETHALTPDFSYYTDWANHTSWFHSGTAELMADHLVPWAAGRDPVDVLDIGCSHGGYGFTFAQRVPQARIWGLDFPNILQITKRNAERLGLADRVRFIAGDMFEVPLAGPYDIVMLPNMLHNYTEGQATELLKRLGAVVKPGGVIAVSGHTYDEHDTPETRPLPFMFSVIMLVQTHEGETHPVAAYRRMLTAAGFRDLRVYADAKAMHAIFLAERP